MSPSSGDPDDDMAEIEAKLEILRQRAQAYQDFVAPPGQPPLLWLMAMLAAAGRTVLPRVDDPDPGKSFPELDVEMQELDWSAESRCLVGGQRFRVMAVPCESGYLRIPKLLTPRIYTIDAPPELHDFSADIENYTIQTYAMGYGGQPRWRARFMVCDGSNAARFIRERSQ